VLELERIISFTVPENAASRRFMQKYGLVQWVRHNGEARATFWYAIDRQEWEAAET
jgi:RimJ/RimL family protein N-acetyltransferase